MKFRPVLFLVLFVFASPLSFAQLDGGRGSDAQIAEQYVKWAQQAINEGRWTEALAALERANDFASVSSDISYLLAVCRARGKKSRHDVIEVLNAAIETNRWVDYSEYQALMLKANQLIGMQRFSHALAILEGAQGSADSAMLRLMALKGLASTPDYVNELARFRSLVLQAMDRYPRDPRPLRIFFEYARNVEIEAVFLAEADLNLLELVQRRLPFLLEADPDLAWLAAPFIRDTEEARRLVASYRAGSLSSDSNFSPSPYSLPSALNLGLIGDKEAIEELFAEQAINKDIFTEIDKLLRSEEGRNLLTQKLLSFSGVMYVNETHDGYAQSRAFYRSGVLRESEFDKDTDGIADLKILYSADGIPVSAEYRMTAASFARIQWERYPSVGQVTLEEESFLFRPADFQFAPVVLLEIGGSRNYSGLSYPLPAFRNTELTRRALVSFCASLTRPSVEFKGAEEQIFLERGIPRKAVETLNGKEVSVTEFERGLPVIQHIDLDADGRMETIRRFRQPSNTEAGFGDSFDFRSLVASSESDWTGEGKYSTGEVYLPDGSVVYSWDMDGSGVMKEINNDEDK